MLNQKLLIIVTISELALFASPAFAYIDPASGSALLSLFTAIFGALVFSIRGVGYRIFEFLKVPFPRKKLLKCELVFFSEGSQYWDTFKPVLEALNKKGQKALYLSADKDDKGLLYKTDYIETLYIGQDQIAYRHLARLEATICIMTTPGLNISQIRRSAGVKHYTFIPHSPIDLGKYKLYSFEGFDSIFVSGNYQEKSLRALEHARSSKSKKVFHSGCPYMDQMGLKLSNARTDLGLEKIAKTTILIAPTWGQNNLLRFLNYETIKTLLEKNYEVIIRPHPQSYIEEPEIIQRFKNDLAGYDHLIWDNEKDVFNTLLRTDVLVSGLSGIIFDYAFVFEKQSIIIDFEPNFIGKEGNDLPFNVWELDVIDKVGIRLKLENIGKITEAVETVIKTHNYRDKLRQLRGESLFNYGSSGKVISDTLIKLLRDIN